MKHFSSADLETFLRALDAALTREAELLIIGGSAAALAYGFKRATIDVDTYNALTSDIESAAEIARRTTGLDIPVSHAAVAELPYHYEDRLQRPPIEGLTKLTIHVPERHDLVLSKLVRAYEHDLETVRALHQNEALNFETLVARYIDEMLQAMGDGHVLDQNFLAGIEEIFPTRVAAAAARVVKARRARGW